MWHVQNSREYSTRVLKAHETNSNRNPKTFGAQSSLPPLPIPPLADTCKKYLGSVQAAVPEAQYAETKKIVDEFCKAGGVGEKLQKQLEEHGRKKQAEGKSWLEDWWLIMAYHFWKDPTPITSNWYCTFPDHQVALHSEVNQIIRATSLASGFLMYKKLLDLELVPVDTSRKQPLCMDQSTRIFATTRIPGDKVPDHLVSDPASRHIVVLRRDQIYSVEVIDQKGNFISDADLQAQLKHIYDETECHSEQPPIGVLTAERRDVWARLRAQLLISKTNAQSFDIIERALFALCLDDSSPASRHEVAQGAFHNENGRNRWFDKSCSVIVFKNGRAGVNAEHSPLDAPSLAHGSAMFSAYYESEDVYIALRQKLFAPRPAHLPLPQKLVWEVTPELRLAIQKSSENVTRFIAEYHTECLEYEGYGSDFLKEAKLSPDAFIQMAIQLAYYKIYHRCTPTYETAQTKKFFHGRTETVRTLSTASKSFVEGMEDPKLPAAKKYELLRKAIDQHTSYITDASDGKGADRHLLGLMMISNENKQDLPAIFTDPSFAASRHFRLSTSNLTPAPAFFGGFGPVVDDGYGVCYALRPSGSWFSVSSKTTCHSTDTRQMMRALTASLEDLRALCITVAKEAQKGKANL